MEHKHIHWMGHSAFRIEDGAMQIYIDPFKLPTNLPKADIIFITHAHYDHFSMEDIAKIKTHQTIIVAPKDVASQFGNSAITVVPGKAYTIGKLKVTTVPAYNLDKKFHPKENKWVGFIITLSNGQKIYHAGDTDFIPEMREIMTDIALLPCGGTYTMTATQAAEAANVFKPKLLIPMHYGSIVGSRADADTVKKLFKGETVIMTSER
ncbi:MAG: MBL fold metallo-hydrolase [Ignavibacteriales bacterium]|nr:MBL fold metallo-hydrolase [Ignavibacteriales bacterium]